jgi:hypothetical protein
MEYRSTGRFAPYVQMLLDAVEPWEGDKYVIRTLKTKRNNFPIKVMEVAGLQRFWAVHVAHPRNEAGLSPFVCHRTDVQTDRMTVELSGTVNDLELLCVYPGCDQPPLPWMLDPDDDIEGSEKFWRTHAYILHHDRLAVPSTRTLEPPAWAC